MKLLDELKDKNNFILPLFLFLATILTRIPFTSKLLYHMDSIQFALALEQFDVTVHQPHPPGYFLYVMLGRLFNIFIGDPNSTFVAISILFSALTVVVVYYLGIELFDSKCALIATRLVAVLWLMSNGKLPYSASITCVSSCLSERRFSRAMCSVPCHGFEMLALRVPTYSSRSFVVAYR